MFHLISSTTDLNILITVLLHQELYLFLVAATLALVVTTTGLTALIILWLHHKLYIFLVAATVALVVTTIALLRCPREKVTEVIYALERLLRLLFRR